MKSTKKALGTALGSLLLLSGVGASAAVDGKRYVGSFCNYQSIANAPLDRWIKFQNNSGSTQTVICPLIQDTIGADIASAYLIATGTIDESTCRLQERRGDGTTAAWTNNGVTPIGGLTKTTWGQIATASDSSYALTCSIGNGLVVSNYYHEDL